MNNLHDLAKATVNQLDQVSHSPERARHKLAMIRIAERAHLGLTLPSNAADLIHDAAEFCQAAGVH
ncbi:MAG: hypothetical protein IT428_19910 [Planctomycetaceae bacterium]|nr:hypothetical protein [Planctomycetaceae bacterium]